MACMAIHSSCKAVLGTGMRLLSYSQNFSPSPIGEFHSLACSHGVMCVRKLLYNIIYPANFMFHANELVNFYSTK